MGNHKFFRRVTMRLSHEPGGTLLDAEGLSCLTAVCRNGVLERSDLF